MNFGPSFRAANAYKQVAVESGVAAASPHMLVKMLFDGLIQALNEARGALQRGDIETKAKNISKAVRILEEGLKAGLNKEQGGELAENLENIYQYCIFELTKANATNNKEKIDEILLLIEPLAGAWKDIAPQAEAAAHGG